MNEALLRNARLEQVASQVISRPKAMTDQEQRGNSVSCNFDLAEQLFPTANRWQQVNDKEVPLGPDVIVNVGKGTYELARNCGARIGPRKQAQVESLPRAIDSRDRLIASNEHPSAMAALVRVSLQRSTPVAGVISAKTVSERGAKCEKGSVRETPYSSSLQLHETTGVPDAVSGVRQTLDYGIGS